MKKKLIIAGMGIALIISIVFLVNYQKKEAALNERSDAIAELQKLIDKEYISNQNKNTAKEYISVVKKNDNVNIEQIEKHTKKIKKLFSTTTEYQQQAAYKSLIDEKQKLDDIKLLPVTSTELSNSIYSKTKMCDNYDEEDEVEDYVDYISELKMYRLSIEEGEVGDVKDKIVELVQKKIEEVNLLKNDSECNEALKKDIDSEVATVNSQIESKSITLPVLYDNIDSLENFKVETNNKISDLKAEKKKKEEEEKKKEEERKELEESKNPDAYVNTPSFDELSRNPNSYYDLSKNITKVKVKFSGKVLQVVNGFLKNQIRLAVDSDYDKVILVTYTEDSNNRILEDDIITVYGYSGGITSYTSVLGASISLPKVNSNLIQR